MAMSAKERMARMRARARGEDVPRLKSGPPKGSHVGAAAKFTETTVHDAIKKAAPGANALLADLSRSVPLPTIVLKAPAGIEPTPLPVEAKALLSSGPVVFVPATHATFAELMKMGITRGWLDQRVAAGRVEVRDNGRTQEYKLADIERERAAEKRA